MGLRTIPSPRFTAKTPDSPISFALAGRLLGPGSQTRLGLLLPSDRPDRPKRQSPVDRPARLRCGGVRCANLGSRACGICVERAITQCDLPVAWRQGAGMGHARWRFSTGGAAVRRGLTRKQLSTAGRWHGRRSSGARTRRHRAKPLTTQRACRCSSSRGMISTKLQGRWRLSSCQRRISLQASLQAPGEPGRQKM
jgi:hypothetical protein